ncbi:Type 1 glutamine amidotransferase-like domain-containing protein [Bifidobacterium sp. ESL0769]|uniref:Type 1 glutamine amidotransferase-like domain-containing protein n=1 Tax=Bifidobacterium sp. ESL0769 TaxID=2983229 RepID=UPI0023F71849|nr:Type 1 glutamine amidotransferase-like domain-containing protein [Bifidobacterium sp. ESL0769]WEV68048.1 Type 1 glutamine amidotransferase-like domain-containing protein [Bifidobacterium sp. ESL0769]
MGKVILASSPFPALRSLLGTLPKRNALHSALRIAYIPTADKKEVARYIRPAVRWALRAAGFRVHQLDVAQASAEEIRYILSTCDIIWIGGGNSFFLLHALRRSKAADLIIEQVAAGKTYVGVSAGAVVAGPDIGYIGKMDERGAAPMLQDVTGLNLVDFRVVPHLDNPGMGRAARAIAAAEREEGHIIHILGDACTLVIRDGNIRTHFHHLLHHHSL